MKGTVDESLRALCDVSVSRKRDQEVTSITAWIDTAFDGHLVFSKKLIHELELESLADSEAILADGSKVVIETYVCYVDWFGSLKPVQVIANDGRFPLLGTGLLIDRVLNVDYVRKTLILT